MVSNNIINTLLLLLIGGGGPDLGSLFQDPELLEMMQVRENTHSSCCLLNNLLCVCRTLKYRLLLWTYREIQQISPNTNPIQRYKK